MKIHMVKEGDTLYELSKKYNVPLQTLIDANPQITNPDVLMIGDKVKIPSSAVTVGQDDGVIYKHVVKQGDTLWKLSKAWGVSLQAMIEANPQLKNPNALLVGEVVNIPSGGSGTGTGTGTENAAAPNTNSGKKNTAPKTPTAPIVPAPEPEPVPAPTPIAPEAEQPAPVPEQPAVPIPVLPEKPKPEYHYEIEYSEIVVQQPTHFEYVPVVPENTQVQPVLEKPCGCSEVKPNENAFMPNQPMVPNVASYYDFPNMNMPNSSPVYHEPTNVSPSNVGPYPFAPDLTAPINYMPNLTPTNVSPTNFAPNMAPTNMAPTNMAPTNMAPMNMAPTNVAPTNVSPLSYAPHFAPVNGSPMNFIPNMAPMNMGPTYVSPVGYSPVDFAPTNYAPNLSQANVFPVEADGKLNQVMPQMESTGSGYPGISSDPYGSSMPNVVSPEMMAPETNMYVPQPCGCEGTPVGNMNIQPFSYVQPENVGGWNVPNPGMFDGTGPAAYQAPYWNGPNHPVLPYGDQMSNNFMPGFYPPHLMGYGMPYGSMVPGAPIGGVGTREDFESGEAFAAAEQNQVQSTPGEADTAAQQEQKVKVSTEPGARRSGGAKKQTRAQDKNVKARNTSSKSKSTRRNPWIGN
ncbi:LysM peptidoglycan-binding domain-containing protein [Paenibacillus physcomitrellae]|uniref:LysM domain-containing protein n=1 Tax=Paenibacillus physcomitrellae TaxID=1619311 RepID=A0ABQ1G5T1_9BACL|nr:LysM peptidoglycan-binding domain-containing protein [Paenibacillus physcomitrellae]GGA36725.1 hypothetical protein GCM10010917_22380 [Paenibacillus physcomitrellae]